MQPAVDGGGGRGPRCIGGAVECLIAADALSHFPGNCVRHLELQGLLLDQCYPGL